MFELEFSIGKINLSEFTLVNFVGSNLFRENSTEPHLNLFYQLNVNELI